MSDDTMPAKPVGGTGISTSSGAKPGTSGAGESGGGAYPNPHTGKAPQDGFMGHGGQTELDQKLKPGETKD